METVFHNQPTPQDKTMTIEIYGSIKEYSNVIQNNDGTISVIHSSVMLSEKQHIENLCTSKKVPNRIEGVQPIIHESGMMISGYSVATGRYLQVSKNTWLNVTNA